MASAPRKPDNPLLQAGKVARIAHLQSIRQIGGQFFVSELEDAEPERDLGTAKCKFEEHRQGGQLITRLTIKQEVEQRGAEPLHRIVVQGTFELGYTVPTDEEDASQLTDADIKCFSRINGLYLAWPYWREFAQNATGRAGLPPLTFGALQASQAAAMAGFEFPKPQKKPS